MERVIKYSNLFTNLKLLFNKKIKLNHYRLEIHRFGWHTKGLHGCKTKERIN